MKSQEIEKKIYFGGGCFWCIEAYFENVNGVTSVISGYSGGNIENPTYQQVITGETNHAEVCQINYNPKKIKLKSLLEIFFTSHDPTTLNQQGNDIGTQYRSIILYNNTEEKEIITNFITEIQKNIFKEKKIVTENKKINNFYKAESYHQNFYQLNNDYPYCRIIITPKIQELKEKLKKYYK
tara:strand:+ start:521 stop:1066 length:546 start_codon:yes stop_codon:yes gene_type:complete